MYASDRSRVQGEIEIVSCDVAGQVRHAQRLEVAQRASRLQQEEELTWDDAESHPQPQCPSPTSPSSPSSDSASLTLQPPLHQIVKTDFTDRAAQIAADILTKPGLLEERNVTRGNDRVEGLSEGFKVSSTAGEESAAETVTSSDSGSGREHWTVVKSPSKQGAGVAAPAIAVASPPKVIAGPSPTALLQTNPTATPLTAVDPRVSLKEAAHDDASEIDELDDVSNDGEVDTSGAPGSEGDEYWSSWE